MSKDRVEKKRSKTDELKSDLAQCYLDIAAVMIIVINANQEVALINRKGCEILGYSEEEIIGKNWFDHFLPQKEIDEVKKVFDRLVTEEIEPVESYENQVLCKNGEIKILAWHNTLLKDQKGSITGTLSSGLDITERKQVEEKLRESEARYRSLFEDSPISLWVEDLSQVKTHIDRLRESGMKACRRFFDDHPEEVAHCASLVRVVDVNHTTVLLFKAKSKAELLRDLNHIFTEESYAVFKEGLIRFCEGSTVFESDAVNKKLSGETIDISIKWCLAPGFETDWKKVFISIIDISARKRADKALRESERQYRLLFDSANEGIGVIQDNRFCLVNPKLAELSGYSEEELLSRPVFDFTLPEDRPAMVDRLSRRIAGEEVTDDYDFRIIARDKSVHWANANAVLIEWGGKPATLNFLTDITERKKAEKMARVQQEQLLQADKMISLGILVSGVAHEINNPNNSITLNARFLEKSWQSILPILEEYYKEDHFLQIGGIPYKRFRENTPFLFSGILDSSKRIKHIVEELKEFARKDTGGTNVSIDLNAVVESAAGLLNNIIKKSTHHFEMTLEKQLPLILGDYRRLEQVIINLVQNACQALTSPAQHIVVSSHHDRERRQVILKVKDEGKGIKKKDLKYITEPFFTTRRSSGGTGLGLSVSSRIIDDHGGTLRFITETGKGTTAEIRFPVFKKKGKGGKKSNG